MTAFFTSHASRLLALLLAVAALSACQDRGDDDTRIVEWRYDFVTYMGYSGSTATFEYLGRGDSAAIVLRASGLDKPGHLATGQRVLLYYTVTGTPSPGVRDVQARYYTSGNVASDSLRVNTKPVEQYAMHPIKLRSLWRTGGYINLRGQVEYTGHPRQLYLMADGATLDSDTVDVYLVHDLMQGQDSTRFWRNCYGSFYVGEAWYKPSCRVMRVHVRDVVRPQATCYDFAK
ncbi:MAG: NigD-like C-terminal domain-containing protein [Bacteroidales bacterium]|nr:NigD-like C-terminal domain-containing protein [Bacteroidales bacterium]